MTGTLEYLISLDGFVSTLVKFKSKLNEILAKNTNTGWFCPTHLRLNVLVQRTYIESVFELNLNETRLK